MDDERHVIPMLDKDAADERAQEVFELASTRGAPDEGVLRILANYPPALEGFTSLWWGTFDEGSVEHTLKELLRVRLAEHFGCGYCSTVRSKKATAQGLTEERIRLACQEPDSPELSSRERLVLDWGDRLAEDPKSIDEELTARLKQEFSDAELVELGCLAAMCVGFDSLFPTWGIGAHTCVVPVEGAEAAMAHSDGGD